MIKHAFSKPSLVNLYQTTYSIYHLTSLITVQTSEYDVIIDFCVDSVSLATSFKSATSP